MHMPDIEVLLSRGLLREVDEHLVRGTASSFTVDEPLKSRRRWILHPRILNLLFPTRSGNKIPFPSLQDMEQNTVGASRAYLFDFKWYFAQFPCCEESALYNCILVNGRYFAPLTVPTGACGPPLFAQILSSAVATAAIGYTNTHQHDNVSADIFIDNIRLCGTGSHLDAAAQRLVDVCAAVGITINTSEEDKFMVPQKKYIFLGILFTHQSDINEAASLELANKTIAKLNACHKVIDTAVSQGWTLREMSSVFGVCVWAASITGSLKHLYYYVYKYVRRRSAAVESEFQVFSIWPCIVEKWKNWILELLTAQPRHILNGGIPSSLTLFTDASDGGWGSYAYNGNYEIFQSGTFSSTMRKHHINLKELNTVRFAIQKMISTGALSTMLKFQSRPITVDIYIDNTSSLHQIRKGYSRVFSYNRSLELLANLLGENSIHITSVNYVDSRSNPADFWSRLLHNTHYISPTQLRQ